MHEVRFLDELWELGKEMGMKFIAKFDGYFLLLVEVEDEVARKVT